MIRKWKKHEKSMKWMTGQTAMIKYPFCEVPQSFSYLSVIEMLAPLFACLRYGLRVQEPLNKNGKLGSAVVGVNGRLTVYKCYDIYWQFDQYIKAMAIINYKR